MGSFYWLGSEEGRRNVATSGVRCCYGVGGGRVGKSHLHTQVDLCLLSAGVALLGQGQGDSPEEEEALVLRGASGGL